METQDQYHGSLVAFEGPADAVSTQLRLLPTSPQVLILPSIQAYLKGGDSAQFSAQALIQDAHEAAQKRHDVAIDFLRGSSAKNKRIVFLSGGTAGAVFHCISAISKQQATKDTLEAESVFRNIAQSGVNGLDQQGGKYSDPRTLQILNREDGLEEPCWENDEVEDPITRAMRAADALYEVTESLQPIEISHRRRSRSLSLPFYSHADGMEEPSPYFVLGSPLEQEAHSDSNPDSGEPPHRRQTVEDGLLPRLHSTRNRHGTSRGHLAFNRPPSRMGEPYKAAVSENPSPFVPPPSDVVPSPPPTPDGVVYGEARLVQMQASRTTKQLRKTRSLDDLELHQAVRRRRASTSAAQAHKRAAPSNAPETKSRHLSIVEDPYSSNNLLHLPQARFVKAHTTTIRRSPVFHRRLPKPSRDSYVHRGTNAADYDDDKRTSEEPFQPVLPFTEDLVIRFTGETPDPILDSVIQSLKSGTLPISPYSHASTRTGQTDLFPSTVMTAELPHFKDQVWLPRVAEHPKARESENYDPFDARGHDVRSSNLTLHTPSPPPSAVSMYTQLPTPSQTPPPVPNNMESKFHDVSIRGQPNAIVIQNALRSILEVRFPPQQNVGCHQSGRSLLPDMDSLWTPIIREKEVRGTNKVTKRNMDLILAIGCQRGVEGDLLHALVGQIEKLGTKSSGVSRSGRLDIRYGPLEETDKGSFG